MIRYRLWRELWTYHYPLTERKLFIMHIEGEEDIKDGYSKRFRSFIGNIYHIQVEDND